MVRGSSVSSVHIGKLGKCHCKSLYMPLLLFGGLFLEDMSGDAGRDKPSRDMISLVGILIYLANLAVTVGFSQMELYNTK